MSEAHQHPSLEDFELLAEVSQMLTVLDQDRMLERVIDLMANAVGASKASLILRPEYAEDWQQVFARHLDRTEDADEGTVAPIHFAQRVLDKGLAGWVFREKQGAIVTDTKADERWYTFPDSNSNARSALCVPFIYNGDVLAVLTLLHSDAGHFTDYHLRLLTIIANQTTVAVRNAQMFTQMQQQRQQLETIVHTIPDYLFVVDEQGTILVANDAAAKLVNTGGASSNLIGQPLASSVQMDNMFTSIIQALENPVKHGQTWSFETRSERQRRDFLVTISAWEHPATDMAGYMIILHDVTTMRDLNRFKDEMLKMASHDLRSPLALIVGYCSLIALDTPEDSPTQEYLNAIQRATERMQGLLDDLLRVEQIRKSPLELDQKIDFCELVNTAIDHIRPSLEQKHHQLETELRLDDMPLVTLNPVLIREAMENLISNAIKYTPEGGRICVRAFAQDNTLHFDVEDNGIGIPKEHLPRIFETFYRAKQAGSEGIEGRGLGLSLVKTIIERHGGEVWVESEQGSGSRFGFWIPMN
ncbi:MAG TPA: ATP-binding protein [Phototrophicaceae bacterium]|nr:ATP-binding protein [Phototrophicaceae bacterium]